MSKSVIVVAPHPDDETLGCGGTLLKLRDLGYDLYWIIVTSMISKSDQLSEKVITREKEIDEVKNEYGFKKVYKCGFVSSEVDSSKMNNMIAMISDIFHEARPEIVFLPYSGDVHSDHRFISEACISCTKWFRYPFIKKVFFYETISETDFNIDSSVPLFRPTTFVDISNYLNRKIKIMSYYVSEISEFPFPRSIESITSLAKLRGSQSGYCAAEAFQLIRERIDQGDMV